jgi:predicted nucleic acid-binding protein
VDTGVLVAFHNAKDLNHEAATRLVESIAAGEMGSAYTTDYVFDEAVTVALVRTGRPDLAVSLGRLILGWDTPQFLELVNIDGDAFMRAWSLFAVHSERGLSFTDCTSIAVMETFRIDAIASFDSDFDGIATRAS